ncbi:MAG: hypothetical protein ACI8X3_001681, partial [Saprospiraceae bacterium]
PIPVNEYLQEFMLNKKRKQVKINTRGVRKTEYRILDTFII